MNVQTLLPITASKYALIPKAASSVIVYRDISLSTILTVKVYRYNYKTVIPPVEPSTKDPQKLEEDNIDYRIKLTSYKTNFKIFLEKK